MIRSAAVITGRVPANIAKLKADLTEIKIRPEQLAAWGLSNGLVHNPSVVVRNEKLWVVLRVLMMESRSTTNVLGRVDAFGSGCIALSDARVMVDLSGLKKHPSPITSGYEDCRPFVWKGDLFAVSSLCDWADGDGTPRIAVLELSKNGDVTRVHAQPSPRYEKNWMPVVHENRLRLIYSVDDGIVLDFSDVTMRTSPEAASIRLTKEFVTRGGSQLLPFDGGYLGVVHETYDDVVYAHRLIHFDQALWPIKRSAPFFFHDLGIEFCAGIAEWQGDYVMSFGVKDRKAFLAHVSASEIRRMVNA
jgi:hypothetical protein